VKFTDTGEINLAAHLLSENDNDATLKIEVNDTGIGINEDAQSNLFDAFSQADTSTTRKFGGTGLGLSISSSLVQLMGSKIEVNSVQGEGSTFWFDLSLGIGDASVKPTVEDLDGLRVLIVDDNATNREILEKYVSAWGMCPTLFDNSTAALEYFKNGENPIDLAVLDYHMPEMDGLELAQTISADNSYPTPPIIMLSSSQPSDLKAVRDAGIKVRISKPIGRSKLLEGIMSVLGHGKIEAEVIEKPLVGRLSGQVLLVEDTFINQQVAIGILAKMGLQPDIANNGREGVEKAIKGAYDLILMDVQMPEMDGFEATAFLRERERNERLPHTPIIAMTAHALAGDRERCLDAGMDDYVAKPVRQEKLEAILHRWMSVGPTVKTSISDTSVNATTVSGEDNDAVLDPGTLAALLASLEALPDGYRDVLKNFLDSIPVLQNDIQTAIDSNNPKDMERAAHNLKSSSATLGALKLSKLAEEVELMGASGEIGIPAGLLEKMGQEYILVKPAVMKLLST